jgi:hypothetical protein
MFVCLYVCLGIYILYGYKKYKKNLLYFAQGYRYECGAGAGEVPLRCW